MGMARVGDSGGAATASYLEVPEQAELEQLMQIVLFTEADSRALRRIGAILVEQTDDYLEVLLGLLAASPGLQASLMGPSGRLPAEALIALRAGFRRWVLDTCYHPYDRDWMRRLYALAGQGEPVALPGFRCVNTFVLPLIVTLRPFLGNGGFSSNEQDSLERAWTKSLILQATLLARGYVRDGAW